MAASRVSSTRTAIVVAAAVAAVSYVDSHCDDAFPETWVHWTERRCRWDQHHDGAAEDASLQALYERHQLHDGSGSCFHVCNNRNERLKWWENKIKLGRRVRKFLITIS